MDLITAYLVGMVVVNAAFAARSPHEDCRIVFMISLLWPLSVALLVVIIGLTLIGWELDMVKGTRAFGFRRPTNPAAKGFAITVLYQEIQFYSTKKA